jgi:hypothetical protein
VTEHFEWAETGADEEQGHLTVEAQVALMAETIDKLRASVERLTDLVLASVGHDDER